MTAALGFMSVSPSFAMERDERNPMGAIAAPVRGIEKWVEDSTPEQKEFLFQVFEAFQVLKVNFKDFISNSEMVIQRGTQEDLVQMLNMCGKDQLNENILKLSNVKTFQEKILTYFRGNKERINAGIDREDYIRDEILRISQELEAIFIPFLEKIESEEAFNQTFASLESVKNFLKTQGALVSQRFEKRALFNQTSEAWRSVLYPEYNVAVDKSKTQEERLAAIQKRDQNLLKLQEFDKSPQGKFFREFRFHFAEKMMRQGQNVRGYDEGVMCFYARDSLAYLGNMLERGNILDTLKNLQGIQTETMDQPSALTNENVKNWMGNLIEDQGIKNQFEGGLTTIGRYVELDGQFGVASPKDVFLRVLRLLKATQEAFPEDPRIKQTVLQAYFWIVDQNGACPAGLLGRSFMLSEAISGLLEGGLLKPFVT